MIRWRMVGVCWALAAALSSQPALAQEGLAVIDSPRAGTVLSGLVMITGTASQPQFVRYVVAFAYSPNPTGTWFSLAEAGTPVTGGALAVWDTSGIADGLYALRLRVYWSEHEYLESVVDGVRVQNNLPTPSPTGTPEPTGTAPETSQGAALLPAGTQPVIDLPPTPTLRPAAATAGNPTPVEMPVGLDGRAAGRAFAGGVRLTLGAFALLGAYAGLRAWGRSRRRRKQ